MLYSFFVRYEPQDDDPDQCLGEPAFNSQDVTILYLGKSGHPRDDRERASRQDRKDERQQIFPEEKVIDIR